MSDTTHWKNFERKLAKLLGGVRNPVNGRGDEPDVVTNHLVVEAKHWARMPIRIEKALQQAERNCEPPKLPIAVIGGRNRRWQDSLVVMRLGDYIERYGTGDNPESN